MQNILELLVQQATRIRDKHHILKHLSPKVEFKDVTEDYACLRSIWPQE